MARNVIESGENIVVCQKWEETERGWGTRPDGFSLHVSKDALANYIRAHWDRLPDNYIPDEYSKPDGTPYDVGVADDVFERVSEAGDGLRFYAHEHYAYPGDGGPDGWHSR